MISSPSRPANDIDIPVADMVLAHSDRAWDESDPNEHKPRFEAVDPDPSDVVHNLIPLSWSRSAGGRRLDGMLCEVDLGYDNTRLRDVTTPKDYFAEIELRLRDDQDDPTIVACWGFFSQHQLHLGEAGESAKIEARLEPHHFGQPLVDHPVMDPVSREIRWIDRPLVWNPARDTNGAIRIQFNRSTEANGYTADQQADTNVDAPRDGWFVVLDPDSIRTDESEALQDQGTGEEWSLAQAIHALCWWCNPDEQYINNPSLEEVRGDVKDATTPTTGLLKNQVQTYGPYLPTQLDQLLTPHGFNWYVVHYLDEDGFRQSKLRFFKRGSGQIVNLKRQRDGRKTVTKTNVFDVRLGLSLVDMANEVLVLGAYERREDSFVLKRGWPTADDDHNAADLVKGTSTYLAHPFVGRKYVLNEAGDYDGTRPEIDEHFDLTVSKYNFTADSLAVRRRRFLPCLTEKTNGDDAVSNRYVLEYLEPSMNVPAAAWSSTTQYYIGQVVIRSSNLYIATDDSLNDDPTAASGLWSLLGPQTASAWSEGTTYAEDDQVTYSTYRYKALVSNTGFNPQTSGTKWELVIITGAGWKRFDGHCDILRHECGILFDAPTVPGRLWALFKDGQKDRVRITCSIEGDRRVSGFASRRTASPNAQPIQMTLFMPEKFQDSRIVAGSLFASQPTHARNDTTAIQTYAEKLRNVEDCADVSTSIAIEGIIHPELEIGMLVDKIDDINLSLNAYNPTAGTSPRRLQIVGFNVSAQSQMMEVLLENFRAERPDLGTFGGPEQLFPAGDF